MAQKIRIHIQASRSKVYQALISPKAIAQWKVPDGMTCEIHEFNATQGGSFRISLKYLEMTNAGKNTEYTDTYHGTFKELVPNEKVVDESEFETTDPKLQGKMTITFRLSDFNGGTDVEAIHEGLPSGVAAADNEADWMMSLGKLKKLVEGQRPKGLLTVQRVLRVFAVFQGVGAFFGIGSLLYAYAGYLFSGEMAIQSKILVLLIIAIWIALIAASWMYRNWNKSLLWRVLLVMQIPAFQFSHWGYEFYSGLAIPIGYLDEIYQMKLDISSNLALIWESPTIFPTYTVNLAPIIALALFWWVRKQEAKA